jgi:hypothetical protein
MIALIAFIIGLFSPGPGPGSFNVNVLDSFLAALAGFLGSIFG